jgi:hypothetical protein
LCFALCWKIGVIGYLLSGPRARRKQEAESSKLKAGSGRCEEQGPRAEEQGRILGCLPYETTQNVPAKQGFIGAGILDSSAGFLLITNN